MGLLSKLNDGDTKLKSLKFGNDRPGGGSSDQPFVATPIPENLTPNVVDFIFRGGDSTERLSQIDKNRLSKYFDTPSGRLFVQKQEILSKTSPQTEATVTYGQYNGGIYDKNSTLEQALRLYEGEHLNKQGRFPQNTSNSLINYGDAAVENSRDKNNNYGFSSSEGKFSNRLLNLWNTKIIQSSNSSFTNTSFFGSTPSSANVLYKYEGGPNSDENGQGTTYIKFATLNDGITPLRTGVNNFTSNNGLINFNANFKETLDDYYIKNLNGGIKEPLGVSLKWALLGKENYQLIEGLRSYELNFSGTNSSNNLNSVYSLTSDGTVDVTTPRNDIKDYLTSRPGIDETKTNLDNLTPLSKTNNYKTEGVTSDTYTFSINGNSVYQPNSRTPRSDIKTYQTPTLKQITGRTLPGQNDISTYVPRVAGKNIGMGDAGATEGSKTEALDKINSNNPGSTQDYVNFSIAIINPTSPSNDLKFMKFRSFITSISDNYTANWKEQSYLGRGEKFYKYTDFGREMSISFKVVALSQAEMKPIYDKLNFLASSIAPSYTTSGYMAGNVAKLTLGNYVKNQYGLIKTLGYTINEESSWDITSGNELPFLIDVQMSFTPIHNFRPQPGKQFIDQ